MRFAGIILLLVFLQSHAQSHAQNLLQNPGFENGPSGWTTFKSAKSTLALDQAVVHGGYNSFKVTGWDTVSAGAFQTIKVIPNHHYLFTAYLKTDSVIGEGEVHFYLSDTLLRLSYPLLPLNNTCGWEQISSQFIVPGTCTSLKLVLLLTGLSGTVHFDDVDLVELDLTPAPLLTVDLGSVNANKNIALFPETNVGPTRQGSPYDFTSPFKQMGIDYVRVHDYAGANDLHTIFPDTSRDPLDPTAYHFGASDSAIASIIGAGAKPFFRIGESYSNPAIYNSPPANVNKLAQVCVQIVKHYNAGWNNGFKDSIKAWEIWNEPDGQTFWTGSAAAYAHLYVTVGKALKQYDPTLVIGGPGIASPMSTGFMSTLLDSVVSYASPLMDYFSYHVYYVANPWHFIRVDSIIKHLLVQHGLGNMPRWITEWNTYAFNFSDDQRYLVNTPFIGASTASAVAYLQQTDIAHAFRYRTDEYLFGLFDLNGHPTYDGWVYNLFGEFGKGNYALSCTGWDSLGRTIVAGSPSLAPGGTIKVIVSDPSSAANQYHLLLKNGVAGNNYSFHVLRVDSAHNLTQVQQGTTQINALTHTSDTLHIASKSPFVDYIVFESPTAAGNIIVNLDTASLLIAPNPVSAWAKVYYTVPAMEDWNTITLDVLDCTGKVVAHLYNSSARAGRHTLDFNVTGYANGLYFIRLGKGDGVGLNMGKFVIDR